MSLKAKLEAVIYAAEEPVTLAQLAALFAADALEWKAEQEAARAEAQAETDAEAGTASAVLPFLQEEAAAVESPEPGTDSDSVVAAEAAPVIWEVDGPLEIPIEIPDLESATENPESVNPESASEPDVADDPEAEAKRFARQRDREVRAILREFLGELIVEYASDGRGIEIREIAGGYRMATKPECHDAVRSFVKSLKPPLKLSLPALETLAVVAYKQPITAPEVNEIRGVDSSGVFGSLLARKLIATAGRKQVIGRPILYKTTKEFLLRFGLKDVSELPSMEEFEKMAAIEFEETESAEEEPAAPEDTAPAIAADLNQELGEDRELGEAASEKRADEAASALESESAGQPAAEAASTSSETAPQDAE